MENQVCASCFQGITNPVCEKCYTKQLALWLNDYASDANSTEKIVGKIRLNFSHKSDETVCINCQKENVSICTYCYFFKIESLLRNSNLPEEIMESFLEVFNYPLYKDFMSDDD
jgi:hypothetical protein